MNDKTGSGKAKHGGKEIYDPDIAGSHKNGFITKIKLNLLSKVR